MKRDALWSIILSILVGILVLLISRHYSTDLIEQLLLASSSAILCGIFAFFLQKFYSIDPHIRKILIVANIDPEKKAIICSALLFSLTEHEIGTEFNTTVENYIELLTAAVKCTRLTWETTYALPIDSWNNYGDKIRKYNESLQARNDIKKIRFVLLPDNQTNNNRLKESSLVRDSKNATIEVHIVTNEEVTDDNNTLKGYNDFGFFDKQVVISAYFKTLKHELHDNVKVKLLSGKTKTSHYTSYMNNLHALNSQVIL